MAAIDCRAAAAKALFDITVQGQSLSTVIPKWQSQVPAKDQALLQEIVYGVMRWYGRLDAVLAQLLSKPLKPKDSDVRTLLMVGLYQLHYMRIPDHAAVSATVNATKALKKPWAKGLCNAVLRNFQRDSDKLLAKADRDEAVRYAHPPWLLNALKNAYPEFWQQIIEANNAHPPMTLRVNQKEISQKEYLQRLSDVGVAATPVQYSGVGITLARAVDVATLPGFDQGWVSVQDGAAQLAAPLLDLKPGQRVLDACAAPGGKTAHALESEPGVESMLAIDADPQRVERLKETLSRLNLKADLKAGDAAKPDTWWDGQLFDRVLLDAPCSATGVIRRHPDIKYLRRATDIDALVQLQEDILEAVWPLLKPGGVLLYVTCSALPQENHIQMKRFLSRHQDATEQLIDAAWGLSRDVGRQIIVGEHGMDGFYYARISKS